MNGIYLSKQKAPKSELGYHKVSLTMLGMISGSLQIVQCHAGQAPNSQGLSNTEQRVEDSPNDYVSTVVLWPVYFCITVVIIFQRESSRLSQSRLLVEVKNYNCEIYLQNCVQLTSRDPRRLKIQLWKTKRKNGGFQDLVQKLWSTCKGTAVLFKIFLFSVPFMQKLLFLPRSSD